VSDARAQGSEERPAPGIALLRGCAPARDLLAWVETVAARAPFRHLRTRGGGTMSVAMTNAGPYGWWSDERGYRYSPVDPASGCHWPALTAPLVELARAAALRAGFPGFLPDSCLINRYEPGSRMGAHRDQDEADFAQPIVSVSLGLPARFLFHGAARRGRLVELELRDGDVLVFGGPARRYYHSVRPLAANGLTGAQVSRINLTLRRAR
jgi:alkylated DNA repair protein (DNA oxidative demethylase)